MLWCQSRADNGTNKICWILLNTQNLTQKEHDVAPSCSKHVVANLARWTPWNWSNQTYRSEESRRWDDGGKDAILLETKWHTLRQIEISDRIECFHYVRTTVRKCKNSPAKNHQLNHLNQLTNRIRIIRNWGPNQASFPGSQYGLPRALHLVAKCVGTNYKQVFFSRFTEFNASHL